MRPVIFKAETNHGDLVELHGYPTGTPGIVVNRPLDHADKHDGDCFVISHARSGLRLGPYCWGSPEAALAAADALAEFGDWQQTFEEIQVSMRGMGPKIDAAIKSAKPRRVKPVRRVRTGAYVDNGVVA